MKALGGKFLLQHKGANKQTTKVIFQTTRDESKSLQRCLDKHTQTTNFTSGCETRLAKGIHERCVPNFLLNAAFVWLPEWE
jgi:hypothetical protein